MQRRPADLNPRVIPANEARSGASIAAGAGDFTLAAELLGQAAVAADANFSADTSPPAQAEALARAHDLAGAAALLQPLELPDDVAVALRIGSRAMSLPHAAIAAEREQWREVVEALQAADAAYARTLILRESMRRRTHLWPRLAYARARAGDLAGSQSLIAATPLDCYLCVRERARIAEIAGDRAASDRWSAEAIRMGPSLPFAHAERGRILIARGDPDAAIAHFRLAHQKGLRWADPLKYWGDALVMKGDHRGAVRRYAAAAERAPKWGALHLAWGRALATQGQREAARAKYRQAASLDLSPADRAATARLLAARS